MQVPKTAHTSGLKKHVSTWYQKVVFVDSFSLHNNSMTTELFIYLFNSFFKQIHLGAGVRHIAVFMADVLTEAAETRRSSLGSIHCFESLN